MMKHLTVRIDAQIEDQITDLMAATGLSRTQVVRNALISGLADGAVQAKRLQNPLVRRLVRVLVSADGDEEQMRLFERVLAAGAVPGESQ